MTVATQAGLFTASEVCCHATITYRQLDYWTRTGLLHAEPRFGSGSGTYRFYKAREADVALAVGRLSELGALTLARKVADHIRQHGLTGIIESEQPAGFVTVDLTRLTA